MRRNLFNPAASGSMVLLVLVVIAWVGAERVDAREHFLSLTDGCHVSLGACGVDARLHVFNHAATGPYGGSVLGIAGYPNNPTVWGFGDIAGIYYRYTRWPDGRVLWTLSLSLAYPFGFAAVLPLVRLILARNGKRRGCPVIDSAIRRADAPSQRGRP